MLEIKTVLAPTDFSHHADRSLRYACALAEKFEATLHLLHVLPEFAPYSPDPLLLPELPPNYFRETEDAARASLTRVLDPAWGCPAAVTSSVTWGDPVAGIVDYAATHDIDLVVIATHGRTGLKHVLLGSVAEQIVRLSPAPVLTIHDPDNPRKPPAPRT